MIKTLFSAALLAGALAGQTLVVPAVAIGADGNSSTTWPLDVANIRMVYVYDSSHFTGQGITTPVLLTGLSFRANAATTSWAGGTSNMVLGLSTAAVDYNSISTTFASNHGPDLATVFSGPLTTPPGSATAGTPGPFYVTIPFSSPFLYDPSQGDLAIEYVSTGVVTANMPSMDMVTTAGAALAKRVYSTTVTNTTGTLWSGEAANVIEFTYTPAAGLYASFAASVTTGASPLSVNFTDTSFTSDAGGITSWAWDFNGDNVTDSTQQNPSFVYPSCGDYSVSLRVTDATNPASTITRTDYIRVDAITLTPTFTTTPIAGPIMQFNDTTSPTPSLVEWDFNGDNVVDAVGSPAIWAFPASCSTATVTQRVYYSCRGPFSTTRDIVAGAVTADVSPVGAQGTQSTTWVGVFLDVAVHNSLGLNVCALTINTYTFSGAYDVRVYLTDGTYVGKDTTPDVWRLIGTGQGVASAVGTTANPNRSIATMSSPFHLPAGNYGMAVYLSNPVGSAGISYSSTSQGTTGNADISFYPDPVGAPGISRTGLFGGGSFGPARVWNGELHYSNCALDGSASYGWFGPGCAGSLPVSTNTAVAMPRVGQTMTIQFDNSPLNLGLMFLGFSNALSPTLGPLPIDLTLLGMPNCSARVDPEMSFFMLGASAVMQTSIQVPNDPVFACLPFYTQAFVFDTPANAFGGVVSDAAAAVIGN